MTGGFVYAGPLVLKLEVGSTTIILDPDHPNQENNLIGLTRMQLRMLTVLLDEVNADVKNASMKKQGLT